MKYWTVIVVLSILTFVSACSTPTPEPASPAATATAEAAQAVVPTMPPAAGQPAGGPTNQPGAQSISPAPAPNTWFVATEILGRPTDSSVTANVVPAEEMEIYYEVGTVGGAYTLQTATQVAAGGAPLETLIGGLQPDRRYAYRIRYRVPGEGEFSAGEEHTFVTQRTPGSTFTFDIQADSHPERVKKMFDAGLYQRTLLNAAADQPDFYLTLGDDFSADALKTVDANTVAQLYVDQRQYLGLVGSSSPVFLVNGNHEQAALANLDGTPDNVAVWAQTARNAYYPQPTPDAFYSGDGHLVEFIGQLRDYYAWTWGDALFMVIDPYWHSSIAVDNVFGSRDKSRDLWNVTLGDEQYQWLRQTLETSTARWKFVFAHHVNGTGRGGIELAGLYEWGGHAPNGDYLFKEKRPGWDQPIHQLLADNDVTIFFQGHDHLFCRQELDGVVYQTLPTPADPNYALMNTGAYRSGDKLPGSGHLRVTVTPQSVTADYVRAFLPEDEIDEHRNGEVAFSYTVGQPASRALPVPTASQMDGKASPRPERGTAAQTLEFAVPAHAVDVIYWSRTTSLPSFTGMTTCLPGKSWTVSSTS